MRKVIIVGVFVVGIAIGFLGVAVSLFGSSSSRGVQFLRSTSVLPSLPSSDTASTAPAEVAVLTGPVTLWSAYAKNEVGADNDYRGKRLKLVAMVAAIRKDALDTIVVDIAASAPSTDERQDPFAGLIHKQVIEARFADGWAKTVGTFERGDIAAIECTGMGLRMGVPMLNSCVVLWSQPRDTAAFAQLLGVSYEMCLIERIRERVVGDPLDGGRLVDGKEIQPQFLKFWSQLKQRAYEDEAFLDRPGVQKVPCDHPAMILMDVCDKKGSTKTSPQCSAELTKLAIAAMRH